MKSKLSLKEKILNSYKKNESAEIIYWEYVCDKKEKKKQEAFDIFVDIASLNNKDIDTRTKGLAIIRYLKYRLKDKRFRDKGIVNDYEERFSEIITANCKEIAGILKTKTQFDLGENPGFYMWIYEVVCAIEGFKLDPEITHSFFNTLKEVLNFEKKKQLNTLSQQESWLWVQIKRVSSGL